jgi:hypothetical protein
VSAGNSQDPQPEDVVERLKAVREEARGRKQDAAPSLPPYPQVSRNPDPLPVLDSRDEPSPLPTSPAREELNRLWDLSPAFHEPPASVVGKCFRPLRWPLRRLIRFALGPALERQIDMNAAQVRFDNEVIRYLDERLDRMSRHYDGVLGLHGTRMGEIDERHLILQQELVRHVHDLVERIEFVFEAAEQNHLYLEAMLRENREDLRRLAERLSSLAGDER